MSAHIHEAIHTKRDITYSLPVVVASSFILAARTGIIIVVCPSVRRAKLTRCGAHAWECAGDGGSDGSRSLQSCETWRVKNEDQRSRQKRHSFFCREGRIQVIPYISICSRVNGKTIARLFLCSLESSVSCLGS
jgi:hypothetical protein